MAGLWSRPPRQDIAAAQSDKAFNAQGRVARRVAGIVASAAMVGVNRERSESNPGNEVICRIASLDPCVAPFPGRSVASSRDPARCHQGRAKVAVITPIKRPLCLSYVF
jgi:hypothetical protein